MNLWTSGSLVPVFQSRGQKIYTYISVFTLPPAQGLDTDWSLIARINLFCHLKVENNTRIKARLLWKACYDCIKQPYLLHLENHR